jgi:hypothetical protein
MNELPGHLNGAKFKTYSPHEARLLADSIENQLRRDPSLAHTGRGDRLQGIVEWLRYWADQREEVTSG